MKNTLTDIRDLDREIVNKISDKDFLKMCRLNKTYYERVCSEDYFRIRTLARYPETIPYKDSVESIRTDNKTNNNTTINNTNKNNTTRKVRSWKNHYLTIVKYIDLLQIDYYDYIYKPEDKSPELLYLSRKLVSKDIRYTKHNSLIKAIENGNFVIVAYLVEQKVDIHANDSEALLYASEGGHLLILKYLVENGANLNVNESEPLRYASKNGHLPIVKYLVLHGTDIHALDDIALKWASKSGKLDVVEYLKSLH